MSNLSGSEPKSEIIKAKHSNKKTVVTALKKDARQAANTDKPKTFVANSNIKKKIDTDSSYQKLKTPPNPKKFFGKAFLKTHHKSFKQIEKTRKTLKAQKEIAKKAKTAFNTIIKENSIFVESRIRPILNQEHMKTKLQETSKHIEEFVSRGQFPALHQEVKNTIVNILKWATGSVEEKVIPQVVNYVLLGIELLITDTAFSKLNTKVQSIGLNLQYKDLYLLSARRILFKTWERNFLDKSVEHQIEDLKNTIISAKHDKEQYKEMDISKEYILDLVEKCEYLSNRGEEVMRRVYELLNSDLSLWHKYHIAKAISSPAFAKLKANNTHYFNLLESMRHSIDIASASALMTTEDEIDNEDHEDDINKLDSFFDEDDETDSEDYYDDSSEEELLDEYINKLVLAPQPPDYIESLNEHNKELLVQIIKALLNKSLYRDLVDTILSMIANQAFTQQSNKTQKRLLTIAQTLTTAIINNQKSEFCLHNFIFFISHPTMADLNNQDANWLIEQVERLNVNFGNSSEAHALIEFLEAFNQVPQGSELTTLCFYLGRLHNENQTVSSGP